MGRSVALQMDPLHGLNLEADSTIALAIEALARGYEVWHYTPENLIFEDGKVLVQAAVLNVKETPHLSAHLGESKVLPLEQVDFVLIRQDPPMDMAYLSTTYILETLPKHTLVLNDPKGIRNSPEKLLPLQFPELIPPTLITKNQEQIRVFLEKHKDIVLKPLYEFGGRGIVRLQEGEANIQSIITFYDELYKTPIIAQKFIPEVFEGDKRLLLIDGELVGGFRRLPQQGDIRSNMVVGGQPESCQLTERDLYTCRALKPLLQQLGLFFVGIDMVGEYLTEINVTSPTGIRALNELENMHVESLFWDALETKLQKRR